MKKYSIKATSRTAALLAELGISFVCTYGRKYGNFRLFFQACEEDIETIEASTAFTLFEEDDFGGDFEEWDAIE